MGLGECGSFIKLVLRGYQANQGKSGKWTGAPFTSSKDLEQVKNFENLKERGDLTHWTKHDARAFSTVADTCSARILFSFELWFVCCLLLICHPKVSLRWASTRK